MKDRTGRLQFSFFLYNSLFMSICLSICSGRFVSVVDTESWSWFNFVYFYAVAFSLYFFITFLVQLLLTGIFNIFKLRKTVIVLSLLLDAVILILFLADTFVFNQFRLHINLAMLEMTFLGGGQIVSFSPKMLIEIFGLSAACVAAAVLCVFLAVKLNKSKRFAVTTFVFSLLLLIITNGIHGFAFATHKQNYVEVSEMLPLNKPLTFSKLLIKTGILTKEEVYSTELPGNGKNKKMNYPLHPLVCKKNGEDFNILFLFVDSLRADMLDKEYMPNTYEISKEGIVFKDHISGGINTRHGIFTLFTGLPGSYWFKALSTKTPSILVQALEQRGYSIRAFTGEGLTMPEFNQTIFAGVKDLRLSSKGNNVIERDLDAIRDFEKWAEEKKNKGPFFGFIFLDNVHSAAFPEDTENTFYEPYWKQINHLELNNDFDREPYFNRYKNAVRFADRNIKKLIDFLGKEDLLNKTIIVIGADHGEEFNDNKKNFWGHNGNFTTYQARVPLVILWPGKQAEEVGYRTSMLDIAPTLLTDALGCENPIEDYSSGASLWRDSKRKFVFGSNYSNDAFIEPERIVIINKAGSLDYRLPNNDKASDRDVPSYWKEALKEMTKFLK